MILQVIGKPENYGLIEYKIEDNSYRTPFSSEALRMHFNEDVLLLVPQSLLEEYQDLEVLRRKIEERGFKNFELVIIPSIGEYELKGQKISYKNNFDNVAIAILLQLVERRPEKLLVDVGTGQNVYVFALIEAARRFATYRQIEKIFYGYEFKLRIATYQPIIKNVKEAKIEINDLSTRSFFSLPRTDPDKLCKTEDKEIKKKAGEIGKKYHALKLCFRSVQKEVTIGFNAIRHNTPLALYELVKFDANADEIEKGFSEFARKFLEKEIPMDLEVFSNILFTIAMFRSFREFKSTLSKPSTREIGSKFPEIYKKVGLDVNCNFLGRELDEINARAEIKKFEIEQKGRILLLDLYRKDIYEIDENNKEMAGSKDIKRNFFAHSGFVKEYTWLKTIDEEICLEWDRNKLKDIENWLLNP